MKEQRFKVMGTLKEAKEFAKIIKGKVEKKEKGIGGYIVKRCNHSFIDADNEGFYGYEVCRFCGLKKHK